MRQQPGRLTASKVAVADCANVRVLQGTDGDPAVSIRKIAEDLVTPWFGRAKEQVNNGRTADCGERCKEPLGQPRRDGEDARPAVDNQADCELDEKQHHRKSGRENPHIPFFGAVLLPPQATSRRPVPAPANPMPGSLRSTSRRRLRSRRQQSAQRSALIRSLLAVDLPRSRREQPEEELQGELIENPAGEPYEESDPTKSVCETHQGSGGQEDAYGRFYRCVMQPDILCMR